MNGTRLWHGLGTGLGLVLAGCVSNAQHQKLHEDYQRIDEENQSLRQANETLHDEVAQRLKALRELEAQAQQNRAASAETEALRAKLADSYIPAGQDFVVVELKSDILFASGSAQLNPEAKGTLADIAATLKEAASDRFIRIDGHTDSEPVKATAGKWPGGNMELSTARARAVHAYLIEQAPELRERSFCSGFGPNRGRVANDSPAQKARNRRVELVVGTAQALGLVSYGSH